MADQIQIPSYTPPTPQFQNPTDLVNAYLNRQQNAQQYMGNAAVDLGNTYNKLQQQKLQNYLLSQQAKGSAFEQGGPYLYNLLYGNGQTQQDNSGDSPPTAMPQTSSSGGIGGSVLTPQTSAQTLQPPAQAFPQAQDASSPTAQIGAGGQSMAPVAQAQAPSPQQGQPPAAQSAQQPGQPLMNQQTGLPQTIHDNSGPGGAFAGQPDFSGHLAKIQQLQQQMARVQGMGGYGQRTQQGLATQIAAEKSAMDAEQLPAQYQKTQGEIAMQPIQRAKAQQDLGLAITKPIAEEVSKQTQSNQQIAQIKGLYSSLQNALASNTPSLTSDLSGKAFQATGGRIGSNAAAEVQNAANPLATALNTELSRRFNSGEVALLSNSLIPRPMDTPAYAQQKMQRLGQMINAMQSGNEQSVQNVANALMGQPTSAPSAPSMPNQGTPAINSQAQYNALPNGASYTWNGQPHVKGKS